MSTAAIVWDDEAWTDIGHDTEIVYQYREGNPIPVGLLERHPCVDGVVMAGSVPFAPGAVAAATSSRWTVEQAEPLTISPSVQCPRCPHHGWIRDGRWVPA